MPSYKNAAPGKYSTFALGTLSTTLRKWKWASRKVVVLGESLDFLDWVEESYSPRVKACIHRELIWNKVIAELNSSDKDSSTQNVLVIELGVAWGYTTSFFTERLASHVKYQWYGFDTFTGLPREWREHSKNDFSANGLIPDIDNTSVEFEVGLVEETFSVQKHLVPFEHSRKVVLFDLDLFEPSLFVWERLVEFLKPGDILYFDEAFDTDERRLLNDLVNTHNDLSFEVVGFTHLALALRVLPE